jgi:Putative zinc- or iron-chelating domain
MISRHVPCNGCTLCCKEDAVPILPHEDATQWKTEPHPYKRGALMLAHKRNGDCFYLGDGGCTIQDSKPQICGEMDCRVVASRITFTQARKMDKSGALPMAVWRKGRELAKQSETNDV